MVVVLEVSGSQTLILSADTSCNPIKNYKYNILYEYKYTYIILSRNNSTTIKYNTDSNSNYISSYNHIYNTDSNYDIMVKI